MKTDSDITARLDALDWSTIAGDLDRHGWTHQPGLLSAVECRDLSALFLDQGAFRSTVVMERHKYGVGTYKYFRYPLPDLVQELRTSLYGRLAPIANVWRERVSRAEPFPPTHAEFLEVCRAAGQRQPTPLILRYEAGGYNELHRDLYGRVAFPLQAVIILSRRALPDDAGDFAGGEFLLTEEPKEGPPRDRAIAATQGDLVIFGTRYRPEWTGTRWRQLALRHGAREITAGERYALGIIFHDAK